MRRLPYSVPGTQGEAIAMIKSPAGPQVPYDFKSVDNLVGLLHQDLAHDDRPIVAELRWIVDEVLAGKPIQPVSIAWERLRELDQQVWEMAIQFDGRLTLLTGVCDLTTFLQGVLRAKYVQAPSSIIYEYPTFTPPDIPPKFRVE